MVYGYTTWDEQLECIRIHQMQISQQNYYEIHYNPVGWCTSVLADAPNKQAFSTVFDPPQLHNKDFTEQHIRPNVYFVDALPREPSRIVIGQREQTVAWPKHDGYASCSPRHDLAAEHRQWSGRCVARVSLHWIQLEVLRLRSRINLGNI